MFYKLNGTILNLVMNEARETDRSPFKIINEILLNYFKNKEVSNNDEVLPNQCETTGKHTGSK
ncbi:hypothetical protein O1C12_003435 [Vibrio cholerae]|nr:hypothetical protein [Vibrio cholerae]